MSKEINITTILIIIALLSIILFSPQITTFFKEMNAITGKAISGTTAPNISVANKAPTIPSVNISTISSQSVTLDSYTPTSFTFVACDSHGNVEIVQGFANMTGEDDTNNYFAANLTCVPTTWTNTTCKQFNCSFNIWWWFKAGSWNFSMNVTDQDGSWVHNNGTTFQLGSTTGMVVTPDALAWAGGINLDDWNSTSSNDPILINNTGNYNISISKINVTAYNLRGEETQTEEIPAANFSVGLTTGGGNPECNGTTTSTNMANATSTDITNSMLPRGNHSINDGTGQEQLYVCLIHMPPVALISQQAYSTENSEQWVIGVS